MFPLNSTDAIIWHNAFMKWLNDAGYVIMCDDCTLEVRSSAAIASWFAMSIEAGKRGAAARPLDVYRGSTIVDIDALNISEDLREKLRGLPNDPKPPAPSISSVGDPNKG